MRVEIVNLSIGPSFGYELRLANIGDGISWDNSPTGTQSVWHENLSAEQLSTLEIVLGAHDYTDSAPEEGE